MKNNQKNSYFLLGVIFIFLGWYVASILVQNPIVVPTVEAVFKQLFGLIFEKETYLILFKTFSRIIVTVGIAFGFAVLIASLSLMNQRFEAFFKPLLTIVKTTPVAAIIILLLMAFGQERSPYIIATMVVFPIMYEAILTSVQSIDTHIVDEVKMVSNINSNTIRKIFLPIAFPYLISSIVQSFGLGLKVMVMAEVIAQPQGTIGYQIAQARVLFQTDTIFAWTMILIIFVIIIETIIKYLREKIIWN